VQGVGYRWFVQRTAAELGVAGWVRNRRDGSVEVYAEGTRAALDLLLEKLTTGSDGAAVAAVDVRWEPPSEAGEGFRIEPTL
jgi:acylphosphatase